MGTLISKDCTIRGTISGPSPIKIDGIVNGDITIDNYIETSPESYVFGNICCIKANINGKLDGNINCSEKLIIGAMGIIHGDINIKELAIIEGGILQGKCNMIEEIKIATNTLIEDVIK